MVAFLVMRTSIAARYERSSADDRVEMGGGEGIGSADYLSLLKRIWEQRCSRLIVLSYVRLTTAADFVQQHFEMDMRCYMVSSSPTLSRCSSECTTESWLSSSGWRCIGCS